MKLGAAMLELEDLHRQPNLAGSDALKKQQRFIKRSLCESRIAMRTAFLQNLLP